MVGGKYYFMRERGIGRWCWMKIKNLLHSWGPRNEHNCDPMASSLLEWEDKWSGLPKELLEIILKRLPVVNHIRFGAVCKTWSSVRINAAPLSARQPPWLLIDVLQQDDLNIPTRLTFKSSSDGQTYKIDAPYMDSTVSWRCIGMSYGWLIVTSWDCGYFNLLNPISKGFIKLPTSALDVKKAKLSSAPESGCCVVVMITGGSTDILTCRLGDEKWTVTNSSIKGEGYYEDLAFYKGLVYILAWNDTIAVYSCDWQHECLKRLDKAPNPVPGSDNCFDYLLWLGDDLLYIQIPYFGFGDPSVMNGFAVFKVHKDGTLWESVQSLGNATLFLELRGDSESSYSDELVGTDYRMNTVYFIYGDEILGIPMGDEEGRYIQRLPVPYGSLLYMPRLC